MRRAQLIDFKPFYTTILLIETKIFYRNIHTLLQNPIPSSSWITSSSLTSSSHATNISNLPCRSSGNLYSHPSFKFCNSRKLITRFNMRYKCLFWLPMLPNGSQHPEALVILFLNLGSSIAGSSILKLEAELRK